MNEIFVLAKIKFDLRDPDEAYFAKHEIESILDTEVEPIKTIPSIFRNRPFTELDDEIIHLITRLLYLGEVQGYLAKLNSCNLIKIANRATFFREIYVIIETNEKDIGPLLNSLGIKETPINNSVINPYIQMFLKDKGIKKLVIFRIIPVQTLFEYASEVEKLPAIVFKPKNNNSWLEYFREKEKGIEMGLNEMLSHLQTGHYRSPHFGLGKTHIGDFIDWASTDLRKPFLHYLHKYKGKGDPRISRALINLLKVDEGDTILDPFVGSGAFIADAPIMRINAIGVEILKIGQLISEVKCKLDYDIKRLRDEIVEIFNLSKTNDKNYHKLSQEITDVTEKIKKYTTGTKLYENISPHIPTIILLKNKIEQIEDEKIKNFLLVLLSQKIVEYSEKKRYFDFLTSFKTYVEDRYLTLYATHKLAEKLNVDMCKGSVQIIRADSTDMSFLENSSIDGILTSPPYFDALDYIGNNKVSIIILGFDDDLKYGSTKDFYNPNFRNNKCCEDVQLPQSSMELIKILKESKRSIKASIVENYLKMMKLSFRECYRVLKKNKLYLMVVSKYHTWIINGKEQRIDTSPIIADLGKSEGFKLLKIIQHGLSKADKGKIHVEDILVFKK
jgi:site-specific DNA-methyltransferase (cytosine-N4-specific)